MLNITGLRLSSLVPFQPLGRLVELQAAENAFADARELGHQLGAFGRLHKVNCAACPAQRDVHYKELMLEEAPHLTELDGQHMPKTTRTFMRDIARKRTQQRSGVMNSCGSNATAPPGLYQPAAAATASWPAGIVTDQRGTQSDAGPPTMFGGVREMVMFSEGYRRAERAADASIHTEK